MNIIQPYQGDKKFQQMLDTLKVEMKCYEIKAYLMGMLLGPENVPPSYILEEILLHDTDDQIIFESEQQAQEFYSQFFALWNDLAGYLQNGESPILLEVPTLFANNQARLDFILAKESEFSFFMSGMEESGAQEYLDRHIDLLQVTVPFLMIDEILEGCSTAIMNDEGDKVLANFNDTIACITDLNNNIWPQKFPILARTLTGIRTGEIKPQSRQKVQKAYALILSKIN